MRLLRWLGYLAFGVLLFAVFDVFLSAWLYIHVFGYSTVHELFGHHVQGRLLASRTSTFVSLALAVIIVRVVVKARRRGASQEVPATDPG
jgi:hypothetical protein